MAGVALGGGGVYFLVGSKQDAEAVAEVVPEEEVIEEEEQVDLLYVDINRVPATVTDARGKLQGYVFFDLALEVDGAEDQSYVSLRVPMLREAFLREFSRGSITKPDTPGVIDYDQVRSRLKSRADAIVDGGRIRDIRVTQAVRM